MSDGLRLLSSIIHTSSSAALMNILPETLLDREREAYDFVRGHFRTYRSLPEAATVREETGIVLPGANETLQFYVDRVDDRHTYSQIREHFSVLREGLQTANLPAMTGAINDMQNATRRVARGRGVAVNIGEAITMVADRLQATQGMAGMTGITSGLPRFDAITGGFQNSDLISIIGRPSLGKTYELLQMARCAYLDGKSVLFVTTEMGLEQIGRRFTALELGINPTALKLNFIDTYMRRRIATLAREMAGLERFKIFSVGMRAKVGNIEALMQEFGPDIVYIDGAYLLHPSASGTFKRIERVGEVFDELKGLTIDSRTPIVNTMQFNRQAGKDGKDGSLETIGFSDAVGMHSSIVLSLQFGPSQNPRDSRMLEFMKGREGEIGGIAKHFRFAPLNFAEFTEEEQTAATGSSDDTGGANAPPADVGWMAQGTARATEGPTRRMRTDRTDPAPE